MDPTAPPPTPLPRIETGAHSAPIRRRAADPRGRFLASASDDKTVRLWNPNSGRLLRALRLPQGDGNWGKAYAVALSPDGGTLAVGGFLSAPGVRETIYIFDSVSGALQRRIGDLEGVVTHLTFSADGHFLAATLGGRNGVRVYETAAYHEVSADRDYGDSSYWADFTPDGRLVTSRLDGFIRRYDRAFRLVAKKRAPGGARPFGVAFAPDGQRLAVGYDDTTRIDVLAASSEQDQALEGYNGHGVFTYALLEALRGDNGVAGSDGVLNTAELLGQDFLDIGQWREAAQAFADAEQTQPNSVATRRGRTKAMLFAPSAHDDYDPEVVRVRLTAFLDHHPDDPHAHAALGDVLSLQGDLEQAQGEYQRALALRPEVAHANHGLASLTVKRGAFADAAAQWTIAAKRSPANVLYQEGEC